MLFKEACILWKLALCKYLCAHNVHTHTHMHTHTHSPLPTHTHALAYPSDLLTFRRSRLAWRDILSPDRSAQVSSFSLEALSQSWKSWLASWYCWCSFMACSRRSRTDLDSSQIFSYLLCSSPTNLLTLAEGVAFVRAWAFSPRFSMMCLRDRMSWWSTWYTQSY